MYFLCGYIKQLHGLIPQKEGWDTGVGRPIILIDNLLASKADKKNDIF